MDILVCVKRVPTVGGTISLTDDGRGVDTRMSGFTISPHEECAVEEAVRLCERSGGSVTVVSLGPTEAEEQLRSCLALGASSAVLLETAGEEFGPMATAAALHCWLAGDDPRTPDRLCWPAGDDPRTPDRLCWPAGDDPRTPDRPRVAGAGGFDLVLLGNEAADTGDYQVGIRLAHLLGWPVATAIKALSVSGATVEARREYRGVAETFSLPLPAVVTVKEGINLPRYPSLPGRLRAKRAAITRVPVSFEPEGLRIRALRVPDMAKKQATVLGHGADAVPALVSVLAEIGVLP
jgi:electron transfer flavoprotein beta subunit